MDIQSVTKRRDYVRDAERPDYVASREGLEREWAILKMTRDGCGEFHPLNADYRPLRSDLDGEQREALENILLSCNYVTLFRGGAGTGKSHTLREVAAGLREAKRNTFVIAPQRQQVLGLENDGFRETQTVRAFLLRKSLPSRSVVLVDEAGQMGVRQMLQLLEFVQAHEGRVILSGDTRQHGAVEAGDASRVIEKYGEIPVVELTTIRRQNPPLAKTNEERQRIKQYRQAVSEAQAGKLLHLTDGHLLVEAEGRIRPIPQKHVNRVSVCRTKPLVVSAGERFQLKANIRAQDGRRLANGELVTVKEVPADGRIALVDGRTLPASCRQLTHGYAVTFCAMFTECESRR